MYNINMKYKYVFAFVLICMFCALFTAQNFEVYAKTLQVKVITNYANIYDSPNNEAIILGVAKHKDKLSLSFPEEIIGDNSIAYYKIIVEGHDNAYIRCHQVVLTQVNNVSNLITPNASFRKKIKSVDLFTYSSASYEKFVTIDVNPNVPIRITDGYDRNKEFSQIQILIEDEIVNVFVKTDAIKPYGIPTWLKVILYILGSLAIGALITFITVKSSKILKGKSANK